MGQLADDRLVDDDGALPLHECTAHCLQAQQELVLQPGAILAAVLLCPPQGHRPGRVHLANVHDVQLGSGLSAVLVAAAPASPATLPDVGLGVALDGERECACVDQGRLLGRVP